MITPPVAVPTRDAFFQAPPQLANTFTADLPLRATLERLLPRELHAELLPTWHALGAAAAGPLAALGRQAESQPPEHVPYDAWGWRVDDVRCSPAWSELHREAARWGLTAVPYEGRFGPFGRLHQFALLHLYAPSSAVYTCPLAMTDGAARTLLEHEGDSELARRVVPRLISRDPEHLWTSGQWMTEREGGSDVGGTSTVAHRGDDGAWRLYGTKWFTSAVTSEVALALARPEGAPEGSRGLSLFFIELRRSDGTLNGLRVLRLKDKLGTRALPTAELELDGAVAVPVGGLGGGVKKITPLLNVTRLHNSVNAVATLARVLQLLRDYARRRTAFGRTLAEHALHRETLADLHVEYEAALALVCECARLLGRQEADEAGDEERAVLRLLTPLAKLSTARQAVAGASEALEGFGGVGYVEDTGLPVLLRDAQVLPIWEGTTNVLSLDVLRAATREGALTVWFDVQRRRAAALAAGPLGGVARDVLAHLEASEAGVRAAFEAGGEFTEAAARRIALRLAALSAAVPLAEQGAWELLGGRGSRAAAAARRFVATRIPALFDPRAPHEHLAESRLLSGLDAPDA